MSPQELRAFSCTHLWGQASRNDTVSPDTLLLEGWGS